MTEEFDACALGARRASTARLAKPGIATRHTLPRAIGMDGPMSSDPTQWARSKAKPLGESVNARCAGRFPAMQGLRSTVQAHVHATHLTIPDAYACATNSVFVEDPCASYCLLPATAIG